MNRIGTLPPLADKVCRLILGTSLWQEFSEAEAHQLFDAYVSLGGNCFDTALVYYEIESVIGSWLRQRGNRASVILHAKGAHHETIRPSGAVREFHRARVNKTEIAHDIRESLRRLGTEYLDVFTLHRDDPDQPVKEIMDCLASEQQAGRIRAYGASNWSVERLEEAEDYAARHGLPNFICSSPNLALAYPNEPSWPNCLTACDRRSRQWYARTQLPLLAWSPLALGFFSNDYRPWEELTRSEQVRLLSDRWTSDVVRVYYSNRNFQRLARAVELASTKAVTPTQIALAWVFHQGEHVFAVAGPRSVPQLKELFAAFEIRLSACELAWLNLDAT